MKIAPVVVWIDVNERNGDADITVITKSGKRKHYDNWSLPLSVWDALRENKCIVYQGKEPERLHLVEKPLVEKD